MASVDDVVVVEVVVEVAVKVETSVGPGSGVGRVCDARPVFHKSSPW